MRKKVGLNFSAWALRFILLCLLTGGSLSVTPTVGFASVVVQLSDWELAAMSDVVVYGELVSSEGMLQSNGRVVTRHVLRVKKWLKRGDVEESGDTIVFYTRGGTAGDFRTRVSGEAPLELGDEVVIYLEVLKKDGVQRLYPMGMAQGAYVVLREGVQKRVVRSDVRTERRVMRSRQARASVEDEALSTDKRLEDYLFEVESRIEESKRARKDETVWGER